MESLLDNLRFLGPEPVSLSTPASTRLLLVPPFLPERGAGVSRSEPPVNASPLNLALKFSRGYLLLERSSNGTLQGRGRAGWERIGC